METAVRVTPRISCPGKIFMEVLKSDKLWRRKFITQCSNFRVSDSGQF
jgi:hypothetical protein